MKKKSKLHYSFIHNHLIPLIGFRVDLYKNNKIDGIVDERVAFVIEDIKDKKLLVRIYHVVYEGNKKRIAKHLKDIHNLYEIDLTKKWDENNVKKLNNVNIIGFKND